MIIDIIKYNTTEVRASIKPDDKSVEECGIMRMHQLKLSFSHTDYFDFQIGDHCTVFGVDFKLNVNAEWTKNGERDYGYTMNMESPLYDLTRVQYLTLNANNHFTEGKFSLREKPSGFCSLIISNLNRVFPGAGWQLGAVDDGNFETFDFSSNNCLEALSMLAQRYETEYQVIGRKIYLQKLQPNSGITLEYGKGKSLYKIGRANQDENNIITRLYAYGSDKNIGTNYRNGAPRLRLAGSLFVEKNLEKYGVYEHTIVFDGTNDLPEIYPRRTGVVSAVASPSVFTDGALDFDINSQLLPGVDAKITFNTGLLAGITFAIGSYNNGTKTFTINPNTDSQTVVMPSADFTPAIGDEYVLTDILMPDSYFVAAEAELLTVALAYINDKGPAKVSYPVGCNDLYFLSEGIELTIGQTFRLVGEPMGIDQQIRLYAYTRNLLQPSVYTAELADTITAQPLIFKLIKASTNV